MSPPCDVLVVDDEAVVRDAIRKVLAPEGLSATGVPDAETALTHPDLAGCRLLICDWMLPGRSGLAAVRALRAVRPRLPCVMITGYPTAAHASEAEEEGDVFFLPKPFDEVELLNVVRRALSLADAAGEERTS